MTDPAKVDRVLQRLSEWGYERVERAGLYHYGVIDLPAIFQRHQVEECIVENDTPDVSPLTSAAVGRLYLEHVTF